jgi:hypothetical protein
MLVVFAVAPVSGAAQHRQEPETLISGDVEHGFYLSPDVKFSEVDGEFANFVGLHGGWIFNRKFMVGFGGHGLTNEPNRIHMGYGGLVLEYFFFPEKLWHFAVRGLIGAGGVEWHRRGHTDAFFVAEPEVNLMLNVTRRFHIGFGTGYRYIRDAGPRNDDLSGPTANMTFRIDIY